MISLPRITVSPEGLMDALSRQEVERMRDTSEGGMHELFRRCALAVLNTGERSDNAKQVLDDFRDFDIHLSPTDRGVRLELLNPPAQSFVDGEIIQGVREHLFAVLRDLAYIGNDVVRPTGRFHLNDSEGITDAVFHILRNARALDPERDSPLVVCWGGHAIRREEYVYTKRVGYELGLRGLDICTGCGPGAMKGPMKGAAIGHAKQRIHAGRYLGITEPGIIAAEPPNPIVNHLVILPDIEKRLEAFVRLGHGFVVFPGGVGTTEELLYLLGILLHPNNLDHPFPLVLTGPASTEGYFRQIDAFIGATLGAAAQARYRIVIGDPAEAARFIRRSADGVREFRRIQEDACHFNWGLHTDLEFQLPFVPTHAEMAALNLHCDQPPHLLAAALRRAFSGIVSGNVKEEGIRAVEEHGPYSIHGDPAILRPLDQLLAAFVAQGRMKLPGSEYVPCYRVVG